MLSLKNLLTESRRVQAHLHLERLLALVALLNLGLVLFDLSYVPWRGFYLRQAPAIARLYDPVKGLPTPTQPPINRFWILDLPFVALFGLEFLVRTWGIRRRHRDLTWGEAMLWRWYDLPLVLPCLRWMRIMPVLVRLHQVKWINLDPMISQIHRGFAANFAGELSEFVVIRVINQLQDGIRRGELTSWVLHPETRSPYIDINRVNEVEAIARLLTTTVVYRVFPKIQPDLEALLGHTIASLVSQSPAYQGLRQLPGFQMLPTQWTEQLSRDIAQGIHHSLIESLGNPTGVELRDRLVQNFGQALGDELSERSTHQTIQTLLTDFLEEIKLNYVKSLTPEELQRILADTRQMRRINPGAPVD